LQWLRHFTAKLHFKNRTGYNGVKLESTQESNMKKLPESNIQWAKEAYDSLCLAHIFFREEYADPTEKDKLELFSFATPMAAKNRGIEDDEVVKNTSDYVYDKLSHDLNPIMYWESIHHSVRFLNVYLDAHVVFGMLPEEKVSEIMLVLDANYAIDIPV
jgi:hypothetical protein